ncbi:MAG: putative lipid II flippase FtsW [Patescibacteria group bacterium]
MTSHSSNATYHDPDYALISAFIALGAIGLVVLSSAGTALGYQLFNDSYYFIKHQLLYGFIPGIIAFFIFSKINYQLWKKFILPLLFLSIALLIIVFIPGIGAEFGTSRSWINIFGFSFQPSELVKLTFLLYLCTWLEKRGTYGVKDLYFGFLPFIFLLGVISGLMLLQPDTGSLAIIIFMAISVFFASGAKIKHVALMVLSGATAIYLIILKSPYRAARLTTFLHPELDPQGIGYHINQAFLAVGSGGLWGRGFGLSRQKFLYLPEVAGDSIFAIMAEELGFILSVAIIGLFLFILIRGFKIAKYSPDEFGRLVVVGILSWLIFQAFFNISSMIGLLPMTGIPLPFISYGGTALAVSMAAIGILVNISRQTKI